MTATADLLRVPDRADIDVAVAGLARVPGDCGDEYRKPPFLTATGDLSDHLEELPKVTAVVSPFLPVPRPSRLLQTTPTNLSSATR